jgi:hypothetical protein
MLFVPSVYQNQRPIVSPAASWMLNVAFTGATTSRPITEAFEKTGIQDGSDKLPAGAPAVGCTLEAAPGANAPLSKKKLSRMLPVHTRPDMHAAVFLRRYTKLRGNDDPVV